MGGGGGPMGGLGPMGGDTDLPEFGDSGGLDDMVGGDDGGDVEASGDDGGSNLDIPEF